MKRPWTYRLRVGELYLRSLRPFSTTTDRRLALPIVSIGAAEAIIGAVRQAGHLARGKRVMIERVM